jgi:hypothetical protein
MVTPKHHIAVVDHLIQHSEPVQRIWSVRIRLTVFLLLGAAVGALVAWLWPRPDLIAKLHEPSFTIGLLALALATGCAARLALRSAVPGRGPSHLESALTLLLVGAAAFSIGIRVLLDTDATAGRLLDAGWPCALRTLAFAVPPWSVLLIAIRRGAPVHVTSAAACAGAAALLLTTTVLRVTCRDDDPSHWLIWHFAVVITGIALSTALATTWLRRWRHD